MTYACRGGGKGDGKGVIREGGSRDDKEVI